MANAKIDENSVRTLIGASSTDGITPTVVYVNPTTHRMLVDNAASSGVTSINADTTSAQTIAGTAGQITVTDNGTGTHTLALVNTAVTPGSYTAANITVDALGRVTAASSSSAGAGTVTSVSVVTANGFAGSVATATSTPAITITTSVTGILSGNGTAVSAAATTGSGSVVLATSPTLVTPALGTPSAVVLTSGTGLPISTGVSGLGTGIATFLATPSSANLATAVTDETGSGALVFGTSPTITSPNLVTPALGTPASGIATNLTGTATGLTSGITNGLKSASTTVDVSAATAPTSGQVLTATDSTHSTWQTPAGTGIISTVVPKSYLWFTTAGNPVNTFNAASNTNAIVGLVNIPAKITANQILIDATGVSTAGTYKVALFSEDGQTQLFSVTTATISSNGATVTALSSVAINPGNYYIMILAQSTASSSFRCWATQGSDTNLYASTGGKAVYEGNLTVSANTIPATITPSAIVYANGQTMIFRLDN